MNVALFKDGTYKKYKQSEKMLKHQSSIKYAVLDISTGIKGPLHTMVKGKYLVRNDECVELQIRVNYSDRDCPFDCSDSSTITNTISITNLNTQYSVYPLMREYFFVNLFNDNLMHVDSAITIEEMRINLANAGEEYEIDDTLFYGYDDLDDANIGEIFSRFGLRTDLKSIFKDNKAIILDNDGHWYFIKSLDKVPKDFKYIIPHDRDMESIYVMKAEEYWRFRSIRSLRIGLFENDIIEFHRNPWETPLSEEEILMCEENETNSICSNGTIEELCDICLMFPQMILLNQVFYETTVGMIIYVETLTKNYNLKITGKEASTGICLYSILNNLLSM